MAELEKLKKRIKDKFKSQSSFCRCIGKDPYDLQILFACEKSNPGQSEERTKELTELSDLCRSTDPKNDDQKITVDLRAKIHSALDERGGVYKFSKDNPDFKTSSIFQVLDGRRKNRTKKVNELIEFLGIS